MAMLWQCHGYTWTQLETAPQLSACPSMAYTSHTSWIVRYLCQVSVNIYYISISMYVYYLLFTFYNSWHSSILEFIIVYN